jgi:hypothetical protein
MDAMQPNLIIPAQAHTCYGISVRAPHHLAGKFFGKRGEVDNRKRMIEEINRGFERRIL